MLLKVPCEVLLEIWKEMWTFLDSMSRCWFIYPLFYIDASSRVWQTLKLCSTSSVFVGRRASCPLALI